MRDKWVSFLERERFTMNRAKLIIGVLCGIVVLESFFIGFLLFRGGLPKFKPKQKLVSLRVKGPAAGKVAIVIDDWGYNLKNIEWLTQIDRPVTISVLPNLTYSTQVASKAHRQGLEVILHLPLEPHDSSLRVEQDTIYTRMSTKEVYQILEKSLNSVPYAKGISNHRGSKATEDERLMGLILSWMKRRRLYFLDSLVTRDSVCPELSREMGLKFARRSVFLDNEKDPEYIRQQICELADAAIATGVAIGVGHDETLTLEVIDRMIPELEKRDIKLVFVSELVK